MQRFFNHLSETTSAEIFKTFFLLMLCIVFIRHESHGEIKNGYGPSIQAVRRSLAGLLQLRSDSEKLTLSKKRALDISIKSHQNFIAYYNLTETLLHYYKIIDPALYNALDTIKDANGLVTDVFVKCIPREQATVLAAGTTNIALSKTITGGYVSEYGERSVSVTVWNVANALIVLAHEFGHVTYQVPNLISYYSFYRANYIARVCDPSFLGHHTIDPSGKNAYQSERKFRTLYYEYVKDGHQPVDPSQLLLASLKNIDSLFAAANGETFD
jgi:hypothetical protein